MVDDTTTIRIKKETWKRLNQMKDEPGKTWDDVLKELLEETGGDEEGNRPRMTPATAD